MAKLSFPVLILALILPGAALPVWGRPPPPERTTLFDASRSFRADGSRGPYRISDRPILPGSVSVWVADSLQVADVDYGVDATQALLTFFRDLPRGTPVLVRFRQVPEVLLPVYRHRKPPAAGDPAATNSPALTGGPSDRSAPARAVENFGIPAGGPKLEIGGSKQIQVQFGQGSGPALTQSLNVHITGEVARGVELVALLSDRNLPLQAQGSTRSLNELDQVTFQVRSRAFTAGLGDQDVVFDGTTFGRYRRHFQGASLAFSVPQAQVQMFGAVSRGRAVSQRIPAVEGYQGPYQLSGDGGGSAGEVVAGSERVYLDGRLLSRGESLDYVVDYERGLLTFTPAHPITGESRILVEYQYLDGIYQRRTVGVRGKMSLADDRLHLGATFIREADATSAVPGATPVAGGPTPLRHEVGVVDATYIPLEGLQISGEAALSAFNPDLLAAHSGGTGRAFRADVDFWPSALKVGGRNLGRVRLTGHFQRIGTGFVGFESAAPVDQQGRWGWQTAASDGAGQVGEVHVQYAPLSGVSLDAGYGRRSGVLDASRREVGLTVSRPGAPKVRYNRVEVRQGDGRLEQQSGEVSGKFGVLRPAFRFETETALGEAVGESSLYYAALPGTLPQGVRQQQATWALQAGGRKGWRWTSSVSVRGIRRLEGAWQDSVRGWSYRNQAGVAGWHGLSVSGEYSRNVTRFASHSEESRTTNLARLQLGYTPFDGALVQEFSYRISSTGAPERQPVYVYVGPGRGHYLWEDVNGNGKQDAGEFVPDPQGDYDQATSVDLGFRPVRDAAMRARLEVAFRRLLRAPAGAWARLLSGLSLDLSLEADRQVLPGGTGAAPWQLWGFASGPDVVSGSRTIQAVVYLFRHRGTSIRVFSRRQNRLDRLMSDAWIEGLFEAGVQGQFQVDDYLDVEAEVSGSDRDRQAQEAFAYTIRSRKVSVRGLLRLARGWQAGLNTIVGRDVEERRGLRATRITLGPEVVRALPGRGRIRGTLDWTRVAASGTLPLFLGMVDGNGAGNNLGWRLSVDYRLARYLTATLVYDGRRQPGRPTYNLGQMEMRATF